MLACCVSMSADGMKAVYGARPSKAFLLEDAENILKAVQTLSEEEKRQLMRNLRIMRLRRFQPQEI